MKISSGLELRIASCVWGTYAGFSDSRGPCQGTFLGSGGSMTTWEASVRVSPTSPPGSTHMIPEACQLQVLDPPLFLNHQTLCSLPYGTHNRTRHRTGPTCNVLSPWNRHQLRRDSAVAFLFMRKVKCAGANLNSNW